MTRFEKWFIRRVMKREVIQGFDHAKKIESLYAMIRTVCEEEFTEDNSPTLDAFLLERFKTTQKWRTDEGRIAHKASAGKGK